MKKVLVLGIGNILLRDEGVGVHTAHTLLKHYSFPEGVEIMDGGTMGMELLSLIAQFNHVIFIDAVKTSSPPGTIIRVDHEEIPIFFRNKLSPHQIGLADVLAALQLTDEQPEQLVLWGIQPANIELGLELSEKIAFQMTKLVEYVVQELEHWGFVPTLKEEFQVSKNFL